jgi:DNA-directed RNA polymerase specialized sigma24 family protein
MARDDWPPIDQRIVEEAFRRLIPWHQLLLVWHRFDGLSYAEMADRLGISEDRLVGHMARMIYSLSRGVDRVRPRHTARG